MREGRCSCSAPPPSAALRTAWTPACRLRSQPGVLLNIPEIVQALGAARGRALPLASLSRPAAAGAQPRLPDRRRGDCTRVVSSRSARAAPVSRSGAAGRAGERRRGAPAGGAGQRGRGGRAGRQPGAEDGLPGPPAPAPRPRRARAAPAVRRASDAPPARRRSRPWRRRRTRWRATRWCAWCGCWARPTRASPRSPRACSRAAATPPSRCRLFLVPTALVGLSVCTRGHPEFHPPGAYVAGPAALPRLLMRGAQRARGLDSS